MELPNKESGENIIRVLLIGVGLYILFNMDFFHPWTPIFGLLVAFLYLEGTMVNIEKVKRKRKTQRNIGPPRRSPHHSQYEEIFDPTTGRTRVAKTNNPPPQYNSNYPNTYAPRQKNQQQQQNNYQQGYQPSQSNQRPRRNNNGY